MVRALHSKLHQSAERDAGTGLAAEGRLWLRRRHFGRRWQTHRPSFGCSCGGTVASPPLSPTHPPSARTRSSIRLADPLSEREHQENLMSVTPKLWEDSITMNILQDFDMLNLCTEHDNLSKLMHRHPSLMMKLPQEALANSNANRPLTTCESQVKSDAGSCTATSSSQPANANTATGSGGSNLLNASSEPATQITPELLKNCYWSVRPAAAVPTNPAPPASGPGKQSGCAAGLDTGSAADT